jgi:cytochrome c551/c552
MVQAGQAAVFVTAVKKGSVTVWAEFVQQANLAVGIPEGHVTTTKHFDENRCPVVVGELLA